MKKIVLSILAIMLAISAIGTYIYFYPKEVKWNAQGIKYRLGTENSASEKLVHVHIEGKLHKKISGKRIERRFKGTINIEGEKLPHDLASTPLEIPFTDDGWGSIAYPQFEYSKVNGATIGSSTYWYGSLVINNDFTKVTIFVTDQHSEDSTGNGWDSTNGQMITAPASSRAEAINITNEIAEKHLRGLKLK